MTESEVKIVGRVKDWLREDGWRTWQEVPVASGCGRADIVAVRKGLVWIVEGKKSGSLALIDQLTDRQSYGGAHGVLAAVPRPSRSFQSLCERLGFGVIDAGTGERWSRCELKVWPDFKRKANTAKLLKHCNEEAEQQDGGQAGGGYWTPFKQCVRDFVDHFADHGIETMPLAEAAKLAPIGAYKQGQQEAQLRRWIVWAIHDSKLVPAFTVEGRGKDRVVRFHPDKVTAEDCTAFRLRRARPPATPGVTAPPAVAGSGE